MEKSRLLPLHPLSPPAPPLPLPCTLKGRGHGSGCGSASWGALVALQPLTPCFSSFPWLPRPQGRGPSPPRRSSFNPCSQGPFAKKIVEIPAPKPREVGAGGRSPPVLLPRFGEAAQQGWGTADPTKGPGRTQAGWERAPGIWEELGGTGRDWGAATGGCPVGTACPGPGGAQRCLESPGAGGGVAACVRVWGVPAVLVGFHTSIKPIFIVYLWGVCSVFMGYLWGCLPSLGTVGGGTRGRVSHGCWGGRGGAPQPPWVLRRDIWDASASTRRDVGGCRLGFSGCFLGFPSTFWGAGAAPHPARCVPVQARIAQPCTSPSGSRPRTPKTPSGPPPIPSSPPQSPPNPPRCPH